MEIITLDNGNYVKVSSIRNAFERCFITYTVYQKDGYWREDFTENFSLGYYDSIRDYILSMH